MTPARLMGHLLLWTGFLYGAFVAVRSTEILDDRWATINWPAYFVAFFVAVAGVVQLRRTKQRSGDGREKHAGNVEQMADSLRRMRTRLGQWQQEGGTLPVYEVHRQIDECLSDDLAAFAERRQSLIDTFGLEHYADIMTEFASAERTLNRMWSASADGYVDEVNVCLQRAALHLDAALSQLESARST